MLNKIKQAYKNWPVGSNESNEQGIVHNNHSLKGYFAIGALVASVYGVVLASTELSHPSSEATEFVEELGYTNAKLEDTNRIFTGCGRAGIIGYDIVADATNGDKDESLRVCANLISGLSLQKP